MLISNYKPLCEVNLPYAGRQYYMQPFDLESPTVPSGYEDYLDIITELCSSAGTKKGMAYMTVDEKVILAGMSQRRPKPHVDGCFRPKEMSWGHSPGWNHYCNEISGDQFRRMSVIVCASVQGCRVWKGKFDAKPKKDGDLSHIESKLECYPRILKGEYIGIWEKNIRLGLVGRGATSDIFDIWRPLITKLSEVINVCSKKDNIDKPQLSDKIGYLKYEDKLPINDPTVESECEHESDGISYLSIPPQLKCIKCGKFYRDDLESKLNRTNQPKENTDNQDYPRCDQECFYENRQKVLLQNKDGSSWTAEQGYCLTHNFWQPCPNDKNIEAKLLKNKCTCIDDVINIIENAEDKKNYIELLLKLYKLKFDKLKDLKDK